MNYFLIQSGFLVLILLLLSLATPLKAQEANNPLRGRDFLIGEVESVSGFGGPLIEFSTIDEKFVVSFGGGGAVLINQELFFGAYGLSLSNTRSRVSTVGERNRLKLNHGGLWMGYILDSDYLLHWVFSSRLGWGKFSMEENGTGNELFSDNVFVFEPEAYLEANINYWMKIKAGIGLRIAAGVNNDFYENNDLFSPTGTIGFVFGWFKE